MLGANETWLSFGGHVDLQSFRFLYFFIMLVVYLMIICSNSLILSLIWMKENLHEPMYVFIGALLFNSLLFSTNVYPKLLLDFLSDAPGVSYAACSFQSFLYYSLCGSEFLLLSAMAYDRYLSICRPLAYHAKMNRCTVLTLLLLAWILPACQLAPSFILSSSLRICTLTLRGIYCNNSFSQIYCVNLSPAYLIYGVLILVNTIFLPMLFIFFTYVKILVVSSQSGASFRRKAAQTCSPHLLVLVTFSCFCSYDIIIARLKLDLDKTVSFVMSLQVILYHPLLNPIVYGLKLKKISQHLQELLWGNRKSQTKSHNLDL